MLIEEGLYDQEFVEQYTTGFDALQQHVAAYSRAAELTWVPQARPFPSCWQDIFFTCGLESPKPFFSLTLGLRWTRAIPYSLRERAMTLSTQEQTAAAGHMLYCLPVAGGDAEHPISQGFVCIKGRRAAELHYQEGRVHWPLKRTAGRGSLAAGFLGRSPGRYCRTAPNPEAPARP